jgi:hypothetical protein
MAPEQLIEKSLTECRIISCVRILEYRSKNGEQMPEDLRSEAIEYLKDQLTARRDDIDRPSPSVQQEGSTEWMKAVQHAVAGVPDNRCRFFRPSSRSTKVKDAVRCCRDAGHEGDCDFTHNVPYESTHP